MAKKPAKPAKTTAKAPAKSAPKAKAKAAAPAEEPAKPAEAATAKPKPAIPPKPVPPHQQFLSKNAHGGLKNQHMAKGRIFRHQGR